MQHEMILIVDFGSQYTQLIARRLREFGCYAEVLPCTASVEAVRQTAPRGLILSGGPESAVGGVEESGYFTLGVPVLGICYGQQAMVAALGGEVKRGKAGEYGRAQLKVCEESSLFTGVWNVGESHVVWMSHGDEVASLPSGFGILAKSGQTPAAIADESRSLYGVQFHPEVAHTPGGAALLENFARRICGIRCDWTMRAFREEIVASVRERVGEGGAICALSGGVDSAVAAKLVHEAIGERLHCVFVDTGLLRAGEVEEVSALFAPHFNVRIVDASERFLSALSKVVEPEEKRRLIGGLFVDVFEEEAARSGEGFDYLVQGTLYPDVIESVSYFGGPSRTIKSHHNVGGLPDRLRMKVVEPLRSLFKDEVRALGEVLGLSREFVWRHPFPGPGLAVRIPGEITAHRITAVRHADAIFLRLLRERDLYDSVWQAFAVLLPVQSVGVMGDIRTYEEAIALRAVVSRDGMTAESAALPHDFLSEVATQIVNEVEGVNRVLYDVTSKPPGTIEWE